MKKEDLEKEISIKLSDFHTMIKEAHKHKIQQVLIHQEAFACDYQEDECMLLGKAIKFAGIYGVAILILGTNTITYNKK